MGRRSVLVVGGWLGAVVLAVLVGVGAITLIGAGLTTPPTRELSAADVQRELDAVPSSAAPTQEPPTASAAPTSEEPTASATTEPVARQTRGGTVVVSCTGTLAEVVTMSPAAGFGVHEKTRGPQREAEGEFRSSSDNHDRVKIRVTCGSGTPSVSVANDD